MKIRRELDQVLHHLQDDLVKMQGLVVEGLQDAMRSLKNQNIDLAEHVVQGDEAINVLRYEVEHFCVNAIATQQPVASDLRIIMAALHIVVELERMGDHAAGVAKATLKIGNEPLIKPLIDLPRMSTIAIEMSRSALEAFFERDEDAAQRVVDRDDEVDDLYDQILRELLTYMIEEPKKIRQGTQLLWAAHAVERIADRATNIAERVIFVQTGELDDLTSESTEIREP
jgi:phosphate transport system protein